MNLIFPLPQGGEGKVGVAPEIFRLVIPGRAEGASPESIIAMCKVFRRRLVLRRRWLWIPALVALGRNDGEGARPRE